MSRLREYLPLIMLLVAIVALAFSSYAWGYSCGANDAREAFYGR